MKKTVIFDFDGTLANSLATAVTIYNQMAPTFKCKPVTEVEVQELRSMKAHEVFNHLNIGFIKLPLLLARGKSRMKIKDIKPFDGIIETVRELLEQNHTLGILTSNSKKNIEEFLKLNDLEGCFDFVYTSRKLFAKSIMLFKILKEHKLKAEDVFYVCDETRDIEASRRLHIPSIAVTWGYNTTEALTRLKPNHIINEPQELISIVNA